MDPAAESLKERIEKVKFADIARELAISILEKVSGYKLQALSRLPADLQDYIQPRAEVMYGLVMNLDYSSELLTANGNLIANAAEEIYTNLRCTPDEFRKSVNEILAELLKLMGYEWDCVTAMFCLVKIWGVQAKKNEKSFDESCVRIVLDELTLIFENNDNWITPAILPNWGGFMDEYSYLWGRFIPDSMLDDPDLAKLFP